jgi:acyl carrier protein
MPEETPTRASMIEISELVKETIVDRFEIELDKVTEKTRFIEDLGAEGFDADLAMTFEGEFGCEIPDEAAQGIRTVGDLIRYLEQHTIW